MVVVGAIGLFLPILQGVLMIAAGLTLLSSESEIIRRLLHRLRPYYRLVRFKYSDWKTSRKSKQPRRCL